MNTVNKPFASIILIIAFTILFGSVLQTERILYIISSSSILNNQPESNYFSGYLFVSLRNWSIPFIVSVIVVLKSNIVQRVVINWGISLLIIASLFLVFPLLILLLVIFISHVEGIAVVAYVLAILSSPMKIIMYIGLLKILLSLSVVDFFEEEQEKSQWHFIFLVLGLAIIFRALFESFSFLPAVIVNEIIIKTNTITSVLLSFIIPVIVSFVFVKKANIYKRLTIGYGINLLILFSIVFFCNTIFGATLGNSLNIYTDLLFGSISTIKIIFILFDFLSLLMLIIGTLKIFLTLKAPIK